MKKRYSKLTLENIESNGKLKVSCNICKHTWMTSEKNALMFYLACYDCHKNKSYSIDEIKILKFIQEYYIPNDKTLRFAESGGQHVIRPKKPLDVSGFVPPLFYQCDGFSRKVYVYDKASGLTLESSTSSKNLKGTVFEVLGDFHHSNPLFYKPEDMSPRKGVTHKENYEYTMNRLKHIEEQGYKVYYIWITDFRRFTLDLEKKEVNIFDYMNIEKQGAGFFLSDSSLLYKGSKVKRKRIDSFTLIE